MSMCKQTAWQSVLCIMFVTSAEAGVITLTDSVARPIADADPQAMPLVSLVPSAPEGAIVERVSVAIDVAHPWVGDLAIFLRHRGEQTVLLDRLAISTFPFGCGGDDIDAIFTDDAPAGPAAQCSPTIAPTVTGDVLPLTPLSVFGGLEVEGAWDLIVTDAALYDAGILNSVSVTIHFTLACPADLNGDGVVGSEDLAVLIGAWGQTGVPADLDGGGVGSSDLAQLLGGWGSCTSSK